jgi:hypothetical protein
MSEDARTMNDPTHVDAAEMHALLIELMTDPHYPLVRAALDLLAPINADAARTLHVVRALDPLIEHRRAKQAAAELRRLLSQPGALDSLRANRDDPLAHDLLWVAQNLSPN